MTCEKFAEYVCGELWKFIHIAPSRLLSYGIFVTKCFLGPTEGPYFNNDPVVDLTRLGTRTNDVFIDDLYCPNVLFSTCQREVPIRGLT